MKVDQGNAYQLREQQVQGSLGWEEPDMCKEQKTGHCGRNIMNSEKQNGRSGRVVRQEIDQRESYKQAIEVSISL